MKWLICVVCILINCTVAAAASDSVGIIKTATGTVSIERAQKVLPVKTGDKIFEGDTLRTGNGGSLGAVLMDESFISIGPNSAIVISEFHFAPEKGKFSFITRMSECRGRGGSSASAGFRETSPQFVAMCRARCRTI